MFESFLPKKFCREFAEIQMSSVQLPLIMATVLGLKPCVDVWVNTPRLNKFLKVCAYYGLNVRRAACFLPVNIKKHQHMINSDRKLNTTVVLGRQKPGWTKGEQIHLFLGRKSSDVDQAFENGWYPVTIGERAIHKPLADIFVFGYDLGYPRCCVRFFQKFNDWQQYNFLEEIAKNTPDGTADPDCFPFARERGFGYIGHMPCSYGCRTTKRWVLAFKRLMRVEEPELLSKIDAHLRLPFLVFFERTTYAFDGILKRDRIDYKEVFFAGVGKAYDLYGSLLNRGDSIVADGKKLVITSRGKKIGQIMLDGQPDRHGRPFMIQGHSIVRC